MENVCHFSRDSGNGMMHVIIDLVRIIPDTVEGFGFDGRGMYQLVGILSDESARYFWS